MKTFLSILTVASLLACGHSAPTSEIDELHAQKDSLMTLMEQINEEMAAIDEAISELDTTIVQRIVKVQAQELSFGTFEHFFEVQGVVEADKNVLITPETQGRVLAIDVQEGQTVRKGQRILKLDTEILQNNLQEIETAYELAKDLYERQKSLWDEKIGSEVDYLQAKNRMESLEKQKMTLMSQIRKANISAPAAGTVEDVMPKIGEMASPGMPVVRLVNVDVVKVSSDVSERYIGKVHVDDVVEVIFPSLDMSLSAKVSRVGTFINPENRTFKIDVSLDNKDQLLKPNLLAIIKINDAKFDSTLTVPTDYLQANSDGEEYIYVVNNDGNNKTAKKVFVESGLSYKGKTMLKKHSLSGTEMMITEGARSVSEGENIEF